VVTDPRKLRPSALCRLLNSTPLGEVINERKLKRHRERAGLRIGDARHVDLVRYVTWLMQIRHAPKPVAEGMAPPATALAEAAEGAAALGTRCNQVEGNGQKLTSKQEAVIAALLTESSCAAAAAKAGVGKTTLFRWMQRPAFRAAYRRARRELVESAIGRIQAATGQAVETLLVVAREGRRDSDRVRAAIALLHHALRGVSDVDAPQSAQETVETGSMDTGDVVQMLSDRLRQLHVAELPTGEKARLTATLADAFLRAIGVHVLDKRLEALQAVLLGRKEKE
jgi:hypothetical protein